MDMLSKIKHAVLEPKVYAIMVSSSRGQILHLGVHYSLEEAYSSARDRMEILAPHDKGDAMDIQLWNSMSARHVIAHLTDPQKTNEQIIPQNPMTDGAFFVEGIGEILPMENMPPIIEALFNVNTPMMPPVIPPIFVPEIIPEIPKISEEKEKQPTINDHVKDVKDSKNDLIKKLIEDGDTAQVEKLKSLLGAYSYRLILKKIEEKRLSSVPITPATKSVKSSKSKQHKK